MYRYSAYCLNFSSEIPLEECVAPTSETDDFVICRKTLSPPPMSPTTIHRRGTMAQTAIGTDGSLWLHWENIATFRATGGTTLEVHSFTTDTNLLSLFTLSEALGLILFQRKYFLLHASAVKVGPTAWLFMGHPGAGKSTTSAAFVKAGCPLLSDDLTAITFDEQGAPFVVPAYPQLKVWENTVLGLGYSPSELNPVSEGINKFALSPRERFKTRPIPLSHIYLLHCEQTLAEIEEVGAANYTLETLRHFPMPNQFLTPNTLQEYFGHSITCARAVKIYRKKRPKGFMELEEWVKQNVPTRIDS